MTTHVACLAIKFFLYAALDGLSQKVAENLFEMMSIAHRWWNRFSAKFNANIRA